jgi:type III pantothenate kinase
MLVAIDVGNTETVIGLFRDDNDDAAEVIDPAGYGASQGSESDRGLSHHWRLSTVRSRTPDEYAILLTQLLDLEGIDITATTTGFVICSSVPAVTTELRKMADRWFSTVPTVILGPGVKTGLSILYDNPKEVGPDRVADAVGAFDLYGGPTIVVDLGTATTFDAINADGEYLGGAIVPGIAISLEALYSHAAALRSVELVEPRNVIGRSTVESIQSGVLYGYGAQVDGMCQRFQETLGESTIVATGGLSSLIRPFCQAITHSEPWLTLHGLRIVFDRNASGA